jgi:hypothetical protein
MRDIITIPKGKIGQVVQAKSIFNTTSFGIIRSVEKLNRTFVYTINFDDGSQGEEHEKRIWFYEGDGPSSRQKRHITETPSPPDLAIEADQMVSESAELNQVDDYHEIINNDDAMQTVEESGQATVPPILQAAVTKKKRKAGNTAQASVARKRSKVIPNANPAGIDQSPIKSFLVGNLKWKMKSKINKNIEKITRYSNPSLLKKPKALTEIAIDGVLTPFDYFRILFPWQYWDSIVDATASNYIKADLSPPTISVIIKYFGIMLSMILNPMRGSRNDYWSCVSEPKSVRIPACYGQRFNVKRDDFNTFLSNFRLAEYEEKQFKKVYGCVNI